MELLEAIPEPLKETINGKEYVFEELSHYHKAEVLRSAKADRKKSLAENLKALEFSVEQQYIELETFDDKTFGEDQWISMANDGTGGQLKILQKSLSITIGNEEAEMVVKKIKWSSSKMLANVARVAGLSVKVEPIGAPGNPAGESAEDPTKLSYQPHSPEETEK